MFKDQTRFPELVDPFLRGNYPTKALNQAVAVAAMCLQEEPMVRPLMTDVVMALGFLVVAPAGTEGSSAPARAEAPPPEQEMSAGHAAQESEMDRRRAVAEAIEWGSNSRGNQRSWREPGSLWRNL